MSRVALVAIVLCFGLFSPATAHEFKIGELAVASPWARATIGSGKVGVVFLTLHNRSTTIDRLMEVSTPVAKRAAMHTSEVDKGVMRMRPVESIEVDPGKTAALEPGGLHIMLMGLKYPLREGSSFPLTVKFKNAGTATISVDVRSAAASGSHAHDGEREKMADHGTHSSHGETKNAANDLHDHGSHQRKHEELVELPQGHKPPTIVVTVTADPGSGWNVHAKTTNFRFAPEAASRAHKPGEGHAHIYVDGKKIARLYGPWFHIPSLAPGKRDIRVTLNTNDHKTYAIHDRPIEAVVSVEVPRETN